MRISSICKSCAEETGGCCTIKEEDRHQMTPISFSDVKRISEHTSLSFNKIVDISRHSFDVHKSYIIDMLSPYGLRLTLKTENLISKGPLGQNQKCVFLDLEKGCSLPKEIRPLPCVIIPLWPDIRKGGDRVLRNVYEQSDCFMKNYSPSRVLKEFDLNKGDCTKLVNRFFLEAANHTARRDDILGIFGVSREKIVVRL